MRLLSTIAILFLSLVLSAQTYTDYIGGGHADGVTVTTSSNQAEAIGLNTINGKGMDARKFEASRFLAQASFGYSLTEIDDLAETLDFETWVDDQIALPATDFNVSFWEVWDEVLQQQIENGYDPAVLGPGWIEFNYTWWTNVMLENDQLRQRMAYALSQILVISTDGDINGWPHGVADFYNILMSNAFGNYKDILTEVTLHPLMGFYLSHYNNPKSIEEENIHPDENYAREIMQLFSIGLYELNPDGTEKLDVNGELIPTYGQDEIKELAKVFTGLGPSELEPWVDYYDEAFFGMNMYECKKDADMIMYEDWHEPGEKVIVGGNVIPDGQTGMEDIEDAIDILFNHPNVGPFLAYRLIQRFTMSNPSPEYVGRVSAVFDDNGSGVRGDMGAMIKAILLDDEARSCDLLTSDEAGRIREPILRYTQVAKGFDLDSPLGRYWNSSYNFWVQTDQLPMRAPSVFNFYKPDNLPPGEMTDAGLVSPEMHLINTRTATTYINVVQNWVAWDNLMNSWIENDPSIKLLTHYYEDLAGDPETMINAYDILLTHGQLSDQTRTHIRNSLDEFYWGGSYDIARAALVLFLFSPDYMVPR